MTRELKKLYKGITKQQTKEEIRLLKKELKPLEREAKETKKNIKFLEDLITKL